MEFFGKLQKGIPVWLTMMSATPIQSLEPELPEDLL